MNPLKKCGHKKDFFAASTWVEEMVKKRRKKGEERRKKLNEGKNEKNRVKYMITIYIFNGAQIRILGITAFTTTEFRSQM